MLLTIKSCSLDNYEKPNAILFGSFIDQETGELIEQDIINGTKITVIEHGFETPQEQYLVVKNDGTYRNTMMFPNTYTIQPKRGNFVQIDPVDLVIKNETKLDFLVLPFLRIKNPQIYKSANKIKATFNIEQTSIDKVQKIGLYVDPEPSVGEYKRVFAKEIPIGMQVDSSELLTIEIDLNTVSELKSGKSYYFRIGALLNVPEAKSNYAKAVKIQI